MPGGLVDLDRSSWGADLQAFAGVLRRRREEDLGLTQADVAEHIGLDQSTISRIEGGARPRDRPTALAVAAAYHLSRAETHDWLEILFGSTLAPVHDPAATGESRPSGQDWAQWLERAYELLERVGARPDAASHGYFQPIDPAVASRLGPPFDAELTAIIDCALACTHHLARAHVLVELAAVFCHYLNEHGHYRQRLVLALSAADAARDLERRSVEGWLRADAIPWTLLTRRHDPAGARRHTERGLVLARELGNPDMTAVASAFLALSATQGRDARTAEKAAGSALAVDCTAAARLRVLWVAGDLAAAAGKSDIALAHYRQAEATDVATHGHHTTVTTTLRLSALHGQRGEIVAARSALSALLADARAPLSAARLARATFELARLCRMDGDDEGARVYAQRAVATLRQAEDEPRLGQQLHDFVRAIR